MQKFTPTPTKTENFYTPLDTSKKYVLAVSGGADSMAMLDMFEKHLPRLDFSVVTINHNLRPESSDECALVQNYCTKRNITCQTFSVDVKSYSKQHKLSIETAARTLRYEIFDSLDCHFVCLAHNADDNAETVLMHLVRGGGLKGASAIQYQNGKYLRPVLHLTKSQLEHYCKEQNIKFAADPSNDDKKFSRNFVRHEILPKLKMLNTNAVQNLNRFAETASKDDSFLNSLVDMSTVKFDAEKAVIPLELLTQPSPIAFRLLKKVFAKLGVEKDIEKVHFDSIVALCKNFGGKTVHLPFDLIATNHYNSIVIYRKNPDDFSTKPPTFFQKDFDYFRHFEEGEKFRTLKTPFGNLSVSLETLPDSLKFDIEKIPDGAVLRTRQTGDVFKKFGGGSKPLNRYLIDKKIPARHRDEILLICKNSTVLIVCGVEISDSVKITETTTPYFLKIEKN